MSRTHTARASDVGLYRRLIAEARPYWPHILTLGLVNLLATPLALLAPLPLKIAVDSIIGSHPLSAFYRAVLPAAPSAARALALTAGLMPGITVLSYMQSFGAWLMQTWAGEKLILELETTISRNRV